MFDSLYPEAADAALKTRAGRIDPAPEVPWFRNGWRAVGEAIPRAGAEMGRAMTSLATPEAVGAMDAPTMFSAPGKTAKPQLEVELREQDRAIRDAIKEFTPNPETTGAASMILHDVTRFVGKAAAYSALGGTPAAVAGMGLDEGRNEALRRMDEGVDPTTAAKLGAVKGLASAAAVALPVAGRTIPQTVGLAVAGGPGGYIAEQATARRILENADYLAEADKVDPFDPLGLGVSFLGPLLFGAGAHAVRRARGRAEVKVQEPPKAAGDAGAPLPEHVDAAHVAILQGQREAAGLHAADDMPARVAHAEALDTASRQLAAGERVSVADLAPPAALPFDTPAARAALDQLDALMAERAQLLPEAGMLADRGDIALAREELRQLQEARPAEGAKAERDLAKEIQAQEGVSYKAALSEAKKQLADRLADFDAKVERLQQAVDINARAQQADERIGKIDDELAGLERTLPEARLTRFQRAMTDAVAEFARQPAVRAAAPQQQPARAGAAAARTEAAPAPRQPEAAAAQPAQPEPGKPAPTQVEPGAEFVAAEADAIAANDPDMLVMLEGMDQPVRVSELLAEVRAMEAQEMADAPLLRVAAECAIRG